MFSIIDLLGTMMIGFAIGNLVCLFTYAIPLDKVNRRYIKELERMNELMK